MVAFPRLAVLAAAAALVVGLASCSREITHIEQVQQAQTCFECHSDTTTVLVAAELQWQNSFHASGRTLNENDGSCKDCHTSEGFVARATGAAPSDVILNPTPIHCFTCHAPHTNGDFRLRWNSIATLLNGATYDLGSANICVACHHSRRNVETYVAGRPALTRRWGPHHSPQGDMLIGSNGYEYAGYTYEITNHRSVTEDGCLDCHFKTTDRNVVGGHSFNMRHDFQGEELRNTAACGPCHGEIDDFNEVGLGFSVQDSVDILVGQLNTLLESAGLMSGGVPVSVTTSADSAGAVWNLLMAEEDRSRGVHNPKYIMGLLRSAILYMQGGLPVPATFATQEMYPAHGSRRLR